MTPEEKAAELLELNADKAQNDSWLLPVDLEQRIAQAIREAKIEAFEDAAKAECGECREGAPYNPDTNTHLDSIGVWHRCNAPAIRALRDSLVETVPS